MTTHRLIIANVMDGLSRLDPESVQMAVTSPPYWGMREYNTATWAGGNDPSCDHRTGAHADKVFGNPDFNINRPSRELTLTPGAFYGDVCGRCGATKSDVQIGQEPTPEEYVNKLVDVFVEMHRVLKPNGAFWLNLGDSYWGSGKGSGGNYELSKIQNSIRGSHWSVGQPSRRIPKHPYLKRKDLIGLPWMVAFALKANGWYLRSDIIWEKANVTPHSVKDRPTTSHEYMFLLTKNARYYFDYRAIEESNAAGTGLRRRRTVWKIPTQPFGGQHFAAYPPALITPPILATSRPGDIVLDPFVGSGTTMVTAAELGRDSIGVDCNPSSVELVAERFRKAGVDAKLEIEHYGDISTNP